MPANGIVSGVLPIRTGFRVGFARFPKAYPGLRQHGRGYVATTRRPAPSTNLPDRCPMHAELPS